MVPSRERFRLIVFDLDGTLIDSRRDIANSANTLLVQCGARALPEAEVGRMVGEGAATLIARAFRAGRVEQPPDALPRFVEIYEQHLTDSTRPYDGIIEALQALQARATLALLTNKPVRSTTMILERLGLGRFFSPSLVFGGDGPFPRKPDPAGLREILRLGAAPASAAVLVGDSQIDFRTARAGRVSICLARYGFGFEHFPADSLEPGDLLADSPMALLEL